MVVGDPVEHAASLSNVRAENAYVSRIAPANAVPMAVVGSAEAAKMGMGVPNPAAFVPFNAKANNVETMAVAVNAARVTSDSNALMLPVYASATVMVWCVETMAVVVLAACAVWGWIVWPANAPVSRNATAKSAATMDAAPVVVNVHRRTSARTEFVPVCRRVPEKIVVPTVAAVSVVPVRPTRCVMQRVNVLVCRIV